MKSEQPKRPALAVEVLQSAEPLNVDAWLRTYLRIVIEVEQRDAAVASPSRASVG